jgi:hypothetical protein
MSTIIAPASGPIVKSDRSGRTRYTAQYKQQVLDAFESSSLSAPAFARQCGIKYPTFAAWTSARKRPDPEPPTGPPVFLIAELAGSSDDAALEVRLPGGAIARATGSSQIVLLAELLRHLA